MFHRCELHKNHVFYWLETANCFVVVSCRYRCLVHSLCSDAYQSRSVLTQKAKWLNVLSARIMPKMWITIIIIIIKDRGIVEQWILRGVTILPYNFSCHFYISKGVITHCHIVCVFFSCWIVCSMSIRLYHLKNLFDGWRRKKEQNIKWDGNSMRWNRPIAATWKIATKNECESNNFRLYLLWIAIWCKLSMLAKPSFISANRNDIIVQHSICRYRKTVSKLVKENCQMAGCNCLNSDIYCLIDTSNYCGFSFAKILKL